VALGENAGVCSVVGLIAATAMNRRKNDTLRYGDHVENDGLAMFAGALALGLEGIVAKDSKSPYVEGPLTTWHWQKIKNRDYKRKEPVEFRQRKAAR
jgi:ATP-dependent DNA ligase